MSARGLHFLPLLALALTSCWGAQARKLQELPWRIDRAAPLPTAAATRHAPRRALSECADYLDYCAGWASQGYCDAQWVWEDQPVGSYWCPLSCAQCESTAPSESQCPDVQGVLDAHNGARTSYNGAPALVWDESLAQIAQAYAETCAMEHSGQPGVGENLAWGVSSCADALNMWFAEKDSWQPGMDFTMETGHFTQVVWKGTTAVGCGYASCGADTPAGQYGTMIVCNYSPPGNVMGAFGDNV